MIPTILTINNIFIVWDFYHYYLYATSVYNGIYYTSKCIKITSKFGLYLLTKTGKNDKYLNKINLTNEWEILDDKGEMQSMFNFEFDIKDEDEWVIIKSK
jgi:hypothetical protein